ncbi:MAG: bifunctional folylpolyglutamate synthase/dihydrofolate synthase [Clostridia bacterium]|nr:bifunctional folylpolyglutamate synthase/dihydrofolate synthase [Clostridia bacterium]
MNYEQALTFIHSRKVHGSAPGLHRIKALLEKLGNPHRGLPFLHIAGTNGKGSTATMIASALQASGRKVGLFTSPFIYDFRERFAINGQMIAREQLAAITERVQAAEAALLSEGAEQPTEFEIVTAIGFLYFKEENCDIAVLEVGMGGRFDATNVIEAPIASVICSISLDHTEILGDTVEKIAFEKAGIIKENCPVVVYRDNSEEAIAVIREQAMAKNAPMILCEPTELLEANLEGTQFIYKEKKYRTALRGAHQAGNAATAIEALKLVNCNEDSIQAGLAAAYIPSRLEAICRNPLVFTDGGHNKDGIDTLLNAIDTMDELRQPTVIFAMMKDKPYQYAVRQLASRAKAFITVQPPLPRAMTAYDLKNIADLFCDDCTDCKNYEQAAALALEKGGPILIAGSLYMVGDMANTIKSLLSSKN